MILRESILEKLARLQDRFEEVGALLSDSESMQDQAQFKQLSIEYADLEPVVNRFRQFQSLQSELEGAELLLQDEDAELQQMAQQEIQALQAQIEAEANEILKLLVPKDPKDSHNIYLEVRAGTGGDEAALFAGDLFRMYGKYAESQNWQVEIISERRGDHGGYKEIVARLVGKSVYGKLKFESGAHRVQRVPETESQGRIHTSACTVAILAEPDELEAIEIAKEDLRVDTFRASGAGGQHVNKTDSAIRLTHLPTGIVVECQEERSQHKNKAKAMALLQAKLQAAQESKAAAEQASTRKSLVGSGDRSERIRTYNFAQGRVTDHRINLTLYKLDEFLQGHLDMVVDALLNEHQSDALAQLAQ